MPQDYFPEVSPQTFFPDGHETYHDGLKRLAQEWLPGSWHGEDEFRLRHQAFDDSLSATAIEGARLLMAEMLAEDELHEITDGEIVAAMKSQRTDKHKAELEAPLRFHELVKTLRKALIASEISIVGLAPDGSVGPLPSKYWKGNLAEEVLYKGSCIIDCHAFVPYSAAKSLPVRFLIFDSESIDNYISHRSSRHDLSKDEVFSSALEWLSREMRKSPNYKPHDRTKQRSREYFCKNNNVRIAERQWVRIWDASIEATGATKWSKAGPSKER